MEFFTHRTFLDQYSGFCFVFFSVISVTSVISILYLLISMPLTLDPLRLRLNRARYADFMHRHPQLPQEVGLRLVDHLEGLKVSVKRLLLVGALGESLCKTLCELFRRLRLFWWTNVSHFLNVFHHLLGSKDYWVKSQLHEWQDRWNYCPLPMPASI